MKVFREIIWLLMVVLMFQDDVVLLFTYMLIVCAVRQFYADDKSVLFEVGVCNGVLRIILCQG